jgi:rubrerythrin
MSEYIDRESLINHLNQSAAEYYSRAVERVIELEPAADVAPVRRGRWLDVDCFDIGFWQCSYCGFLSEAIAAPKLYKYCPNCGAKLEVPNDN